MCVYVRISILFTRACSMYVLVYMYLSTNLLYLLDTCRCTSKADNPTTLDAVSGMAYQVCTYVCVNSEYSVICLNLFPKHMVD